MRLDDLIETTFRLSPPQRTALKKLGLFTIEDLLFHLPVRYQREVTATTINQIQKGQIVTIHGKISGLKLSRAFYKKIPMAEGVLEDTTGKIKAVWFNQPYLAKMLKEGGWARLSGKVSERKGELYLSNPDSEALSEPPGETGALFGESGEGIFAYPVYAESRGITSRWFFYALTKILKSGLIETLEDPIPEDILDRYHLPSLQTALVWIHTPKKEADAVAARKRLAFQEIFYIQLEKQKDRAKNAEAHSFSITKDRKALEEFLKNFPFKPTAAQEKTIAHIMDDFAKDHPMSRLLEGDVGSGKTAVAATAAFATATTRPSGQSFGTLQVAYMAPTEILATQHFESFIEYFRHFPVQIGLITGSGCRKFPAKTRTTRGPHAGEVDWTDISRGQLLKWVVNGEIAILIGTHALIQKSVQFKHLGLIIIDEQHRFGTSQRQALVRGKVSTRKDFPEEKPKEKIDPLIYRDLTYRIREALLRVKKELGLGHREAVYQKALAEEFKRMKLPFSREVRIPVMYQRKEVGIYIPDFVLDRKVILEIKTIPFIGAREKKQVWSYLKGSDYRLALLANFGPTTVDIQRIVYDQARGPREVGEMSASVPHLLSMTATPIPRTLALTIYGDLDLSLLDEMPAGRKRIITEIVEKNERKVVYEKIRKELKAGRQAYIICPRIDEPDPTKELALNAKSVKAEAKRLKEDVFQEYSIDILHSKMKPAEKDATMLDFKAHKIDILVATSVVEVGVNVPNATVIVIEGGERFGLSQLHQLRGRVVRSNHQAYCYVFTESKGPKTRDRLRALETARNGFELAEKDLEQRGAGELSGRKQWGISDVGMEGIKNIKMVEAARQEAGVLVAKDPELRKYPLLREQMAKRAEPIHFE